MGALLTPPVDPTCAAGVIFFDNAGYLGMPAKGGDAALSDWTINAATQYMLEITFPNRPRD